MSELFELEQLRLSQLRFCRFSASCCCSCWYRAIFSSTFWAARIFSKFRRPPVPLKARNWSSRPCSDKCWIIKQISSLWKRLLQIINLTRRIGTALSFDDTTTILGVWLKVAFRSRMKTPKNGTTRLWGVRTARASARRYSALVCLDNRALARKSSWGSFSFSVMESQNGFSLSDLFWYTNCSLKSTVAS